VFHVTGVQTCALPIYFYANINTNVVGLPTYDTYVQVYQGDCDNLSCIGHDDNSGGSGGTSYLTFLATAGTTYYIVFENRYNSSRSEERRVEKDFINRL